MRVLVVVASATGRTHRLAEAVADGAREAGADALLRSAEAAGEDELLAADAVILGSGVHMGGVESSMSAFFERMAPLWLGGRLVGKLGAAFASAGEGERGGAELALLVLLSNLAEHGMLLVPVPNRSEGFRQAGCHWGVFARTNPGAGGVGPTERDLAAARAHGRHVAACTDRWLRGREAESRLRRAPDERA